MNSSLVLLDVDETVIDTQYRLTCDLARWQSSVRLAEAKGMTVGLNSDSALQTLRRRALLYGITGPIVAERGAVLSRRLDVKADYLNPEAENFQILRRALLCALSLDDRPLRYLTVNGDVNELSGCLPALSAEACFSDIAVLVNGFRSASFSCYVRKREGERWVKDTEALDEIISLVESLAREEFPSWQEIKEMDRNPAYGICIMHHRLTKKAMAVEPLSRLFPGQRIYMIGNSMSDYMEDERVIHCAVGNASAEFKERSLFVAKADRTEGVIELLEQIAHQ